MSHSEPAPGTLAHIVQIRPWDRWPRAILGKVAAAHKLPPAAIVGKTKSMVLAKARRDVARALHQEGFSLLLISRVLGGRHLVTINEYLDDDYRNRRNRARLAILRRERAGKLRRATA